MHDQKDNFQSKDLKEENHSQGTYKVLTAVKCKASDCDNCVQAVDVIFKYCSPECRDRELLAKHQSQLRSDIEQLEKELQMLSPPVIDPLKDYVPLTCKANGCDEMVYIDQSLRLVFDYCSVDCRDKEMLTSHNLQLEFDIKDLESDIKKLPITLKTCKVTGCNEFVHFNPTLQCEFDYCSPGCRDKDLLSINSRKLQFEIEELKNDILKLPLQNSKKQSKSWFSFFFGGTY